MTAPDFAGFRKAVVEEYLEAVGRSACMGFLDWIQNACNLMQEHEELTGDEAAGARKLVMAIREAAAAKWELLAMPKNEQEWRQHLADLKKKHDPSGAIALFDSLGLSGLLFGGGL